MYDKPHVHEILQPVPLTKLNVLIHPLWAIFPTSRSDDAVERFDRERRIFAQSIVGRMTASAPDEATLILPLTVGERHESLHNRVIAAKNYSDFVQWPDLYRDMVQKAGHGRNIVMGRNIVSNDKERVIDPQTVREDLLKRGFRLTNATEVIVGGELLDACLTEGIDNLFRLPEIKTIKVDIACTLDVGYLFGSHSSLKESDYKRFAEHYVSAGFDVSTATDYYTISKKIG